MKKLTKKQLKKIKKIMKKQEALMKVIEAGLNLDKGKKYLIDYKTGEVTERKND